MLVPKSFESKKNLGTKNFGLRKFLGSEKFWVQKNCWSRKIVGPEKLWVQKNFGSRKILSPKEFWASKNFGPWKFRAQKDLGPKKILDPKNLYSKIFWFQTILVPKNLGTENFGSRNYFGEAAKLFSILDMSLEVKLLKHEPKPNHTKPNCSKPLGLSNFCE